jgi:hypothetical protein
VVIASESGIFISSLNDISNAVASCIEAEGLILTEADLASEFFDLSSGLLGELFQKLTNYRVRAAIVVADFKAYGERFSELANEHSSHSLLRFVVSKDEALKWLA